MIIDLIRLEFEERGGRRWGWWWGGVLEILCKEEDGMGADWTSSCDENK